ncbi:Peptidase M28 [Zalerion maritima]|uniref:Peptidase M28 n=1 Tax=Zalerion maritima TaxID=339359 RepID=A0AAD5WS40_9PEZI|nr:Peptidase M28 [Zalerion maritima]
MPPSGSQGYDALPPIPSYDEAVSLQPPRSPIDDRSANETESQSLLRNASTSGPSGRRPAGYRAPTVETDDEDSLDGWESSDDSEAEVRREMHEFDIEEPVDSAAYRWGKRIGQWRWKWNLRMPSIRLPSLGTSQQPPDTESGSTTNRGTEGGSGQQQDDGATSALATTRSRLARLFPRNIPKMNSTSVFLLLARVLALSLLLGFLYLLFLSDMFAGMARRMESRVFPPELVREHIQKSVNPHNMRQILREFSSYAHIAGTEGDFGLAEDVERMFITYGLEEVSISEYYCYLNYPKEDGREVYIMNDDGETIKWEAALEEPELGGEKSGHQTFVFHGLSKSGEATGPLVYANYGSRSDFQKLKDMGVKTDGAIAIMRYYGTQPHLGMKVKAAEEAGFIGCLIYTDPADNGHAKTKEAPEGRSMPSSGVQRGSVGLTPWVLGDPLTPGWESTKDLPRMKLQDTTGLVKIPSLPLSAHDAQMLLQSIQGVGEKVPKEWQGSVPIDTYWTGDESSPKVHMANKNDEVEKQPIWNVHGKIVGVEQNHKNIIIGNHRDAWASGATSPGSGTAVFLELARIFGGLRDSGWRPRRSVIFASWDAEEYNMMGSTEFVEHHLKNLQDDGYAYINLDAAVAGDMFRASGSPVFHLPLLRALNRVADPFYNTSLRHLWDENKTKLQGVGLDGDYLAFQDLAGTSSIDLGFGGSPFPEASSYDNFHWMDKVGDPGFIYHSLLTEVVGLLILELADQPILPFDMSAYAGSLQKYVDDVKAWAKGKGSEKAAEFDGFDKMIDAVRSVAGAVNTFEAWAMSWQNTIVGGGGWESTGLGEKRYRYNDKMAAFETALLDLGPDGGLPNRTQYKHVVYGPQKWGAYEEAFFPGIRDAIEDGDWKLANEMVEKTAGIMVDAADVLGDEKKEGGKNGDRDEKSRRARSKRWWSW